MPFDADQREKRLYRDDAPTPREPPRVPSSIGSAMAYRHMSDIVRNQNPLTLSARASVKEACAAMRNRQVGAVLVTEGDRHLLGIFTGRDAVCRVLAEGKDPATTSLAEVMTAAPDTMPPGMSAIDALRQMQDCGYRHIPVVANGKVVGIVSRGDFKGLEIDRVDEETGLWERI
jgi:CBS domain-containing protein